MDCSAGEVLHSLLGTLHHRGIQPILAEVADDVRPELDRYGIMKLIGTEAIYGGVGDVLRAYDPGRPAAAPSVSAGPHPGAPTRACLAIEMRKNQSRLWPVRKTELEEFAPPWVHCMPGCDRHVCGRRTGWVRSRSCFRNPRRPRAAPAVVCLSASAG